MPKASQSPIHWLKVLQESTDPLCLDEIRGLPASTTHWLLLHPDDPSARQLLELLATDRRSEIRLAVGRSLDAMPEPLFSRLAQVMSQDSNTYVKQAAKRALQERAANKRHAAAVHPGREATLSEIEKLYDSTAAHMASKVAEARANEFLLSVVHELKTIAGRIRSGTFGLRHYVPADHDAERFMAVIDRAASDVEFLVSSISALSRPGELHLENESICDLIEKALESAKAGLRSRGDDIAPVEVSVHCPEPVHARISRSHFVLAMAHVIKNAIEAHGHSMSYLPGHVSISITQEHNRVRIVIADDGCGLRSNDAAVLNEFLPGRSSKPGGAGYGLPIAKSYIDAHQGTLKLESEQGLGTTVTVELPIDGGKPNDTRASG